MSKNQQYAERYAVETMEQMKRYGIPASVTLAQGILESRNGQSELSQLGNNHFGVKASKSWLKSGGDYLVYTDDKPNEKFCKSPPRWVTHTAPFQDIEEQQPLQPMLQTLSR